MPRKRVSSTKEVKKSLLALIIAVLLVTTIVSAAVVVSIDRVDLITNYANIPGQVFSILLSGSAVGTDSILADLNAGDKQTADGYKTTHDLEIKLEGTENYCVSNLQLDTGVDALFKNVYTVFVENRVWWWYEVPSAGAQRDQFLRNYCGELTDLGVGRSNFLNFQFACPRKAIIYGNIGTIASPNEEFRTKISATPSKPGSLTETATLGNAQTKQGVSAKIGNNVWVEWLGNLKSGINCQQPLNERSLISTDGWKIIDKSAYDVGWISWVTNSFQQCILNIMNDPFNADPNRFNTECAAQWNTKAGSAATTKTTGEFINQGSMQLRDTSSYFSPGTQGQAKFTVNRLFVYPQFRLLVDADWVGIYKPVGRPEILSATSAKFTEGTPGYILATVKNKGDALGSFSLQAICKGDFTYDDQIYVFNLNAGEQKTQQMRIGMVSNSQESTVSDTCTVYFKETFSQEEIGFNVAVTADQIQNCIPNQKSCSGSKILQCDSQGQKYVQLQDCASESKICQYVNNQPECRFPGGAVEICDNKIDDNGNGQIDEPPCGQGGECRPIFGFIPNIPCLLIRFFATIVFWVIVIVVLIGGAYFALKFTLFRRRE